MTATRGVFSHLITPGFRKVVFETYKQKPTEASKWINMQKADRAFIDDFNLGGFGTLVDKTEGGAITYQDPVPGRTKRYIWNTYALGFRITQEMMEDDLYGVMGNKMSRALGRSARHNFEVVAHSVLNNAFSTSFVGFETGVSLISTAHTTLRGGTVANRPALDVDVGMLSLQAGIENFAAIPDESGLPTLFTPKYLVYGPADQWIVAQLLGSTGLPGTNFNDINPLRGMGITPIMSHYLTDADAWYLLSEDHDLNYFDRRQPAFSNTDDFDTGDAKFKLTRRNGAGFGDWRGVYGSSGG